jgi:deoxyadenosine/deoxycytidine kinase
MGKIISVVGNLGAGKTTLAKLICDRGSFIPCWERPEDRPFQPVIDKNLSRWALANQVDFFLFRCQQELAARQSRGIAVFDGGLDQDFHVFTRHLSAQGYLNPDEFDVCQRVYHFTREVLPPPDLIVRIIVDFPTLLQRRSARGRKTVDQSYSSRQLADLETLLDEWLKSAIPSPVVEFPFDRDFHSYMDEIDELVGRINKS